MDNLDFTPFYISFKLALTTTVILFIIALPLAWWLSQTKSKSKPFIEALVTLPIVLPPSVIGFYIIVALSPNAAVGGFFREAFDIELIFSFTGLVIASCFYSFPFMVQPLQSGFSSLNHNMIEASYLCGKSTFVTLFKVALPNIKPALLTALIITFAHTVGEFGVVLMVGGMQDETTKVASIAIYEFVNNLEYTSAHIYSIIMIAVSFIILLVTYYFNMGHNRRFGLLK